MFSKRKFDVSHLYEFIKSRSGRYVICFDMVHLMYINDTFFSLGLSEEDNEKILWRNAKRLFRLESVE